MDHLTLTASLLVPCVQQARAASAVAWDPTEGRKGGIPYGRVFGAPTQSDAEFQALQKGVAKEGSTVVSLDLADSPDMAHFPSARAWHGKDPLREAGLKTGIGVACGRHSP